MILAFLVRWTEFFGNFFWIRHKANIHNACHNNLYSPLLNYPAHISAYPDAWNAKFLIIVGIQHTKSLIKVLDLLLFLVKLCLAVEIMLRRNSKFWLCSTVLSVWAVNCVVEMTVGRRFSNSRPRGGGAQLGSTQPTHSPISLVLDLHRAPLPLADQPKLGQSRRRAWGFVSPSGRIFPRRHKRISPADQQDLRNTELGVW